MSESFWNEAIQSAKEQVAELRKSDLSEIRLHPENITRYHFCHYSKYPMWIPVVTTAISSVLSALFCPNKDKIFTILCVYGLIMATGIFSSSWTFNHKPSYITDDGVVDTSENFTKSMIIAEIIACIICTVLEVFSVGAYAIVANMIWMVVNIAWYAITSSLPQFQNVCHRYRLILVISSIVIVVVGLTYASGMVLIGIWSSLFIAVAAYIVVKFITTGSIGEVIGIALLALFF